MNRTQTPLRSSVSSSEKCKGQPPLSTTATIDKDHICMDQCLAHGIYGANISSLLQLGQGQASISVTEHKAQRREKAPSTCPLSREHKACHQKEGPQGRWQRPLRLTSLLLLQSQASLCQFLPTPLVLLSSGPGPLLFPSMPLLSDPVQFLGSKNHIHADNP